MGTPTGRSAYLDVPGYLLATTGQETASLLGLNTLVAASDTVAGTVTLTVTSSSGWQPGPLWLLDGPASEIVQVTSAPDATHLILANPGTEFAHAAGVSASQQGSGGGLAEILLRASAWIENFCQQGSSATDRSLFASQRSERWGLPSMRAFVDRDNIIVVRPGHSPVQSVSSIAIAFGQAASHSTPARPCWIRADGLSKCHTVRQAHSTPGSCSC